MKLKDINQVYVHEEINVGNYITGMGFTKIYNKKSFIVSTKGGAGTVILCAYLDSIYHIFFQNNISPAKINIST